MIPLRDDVPSRTVPFVTYGLIVLNAAAFVLELGMGPKLESFLTQSAVIPVLYTGADRALGPAEPFTTLVQGGLGVRVVLSMFLHGGWAHIIGNMLYLWIFGDNVEDRMGHGRFLAFYLLCGWAATYAHIWADPRSRLPAIGASGAIAGVLGAYVTLFPHAKVVTLLPLGLFSSIFEVRALYFLGFWFVQQFVSGALSLGARTSAEGGVAWFAHIGGFAAGFALVALFARPGGPTRARDFWWEEHRSRRSGRR